MQASCVRLRIQVLLQQQSLASLVLVLMPWRNRWLVISFDQDKVSIPYSSLMLLTEKVTLASTEEDWTACSSRWISSHKLCSAEGKCVYLIGICYRGFNSFLSSYSFAHVELTISIWADNTGFEDAPLIVCWVELGQELVDPLSCAAESLVDILFYGIFHGKSIKHPTINVILY